jgi:tetratricopeptide (TPR) repeat protein
MKASPHMSWRRTWIGGAYAIGAFVLLVVAYMVLRALGIGPFGSLMAAGTLQRDERLLVTDFAPPARDSSLGPVITDAFRTALGESRSMTIMQPQQVADVLRRMQRPANTHVDFTIGREIATREGIRGVVVGDIISLGGSYAIAVRLVSPQTGDELASFRETADSDKELLHAIDKLARSLRAKIGESLKNVQGTRAFEQVTTPSLEALKKYVQGSLALSLDGDFPKGSALLEQAIALDTGFAMAYRKLAIEYGNRGQLDKQMELFQKAYDHRDRLTDVERYYVLGGYYSSGPHPDLVKSIQSYESAIEIQPNLVGALNNLGLNYRIQRNWQKSEEMYSRAVRGASPPAVSFSGLAQVQWMLGKSAEAWRTMSAYDSAYPINAGRLTTRANFLALEGKPDSAEVLLKALIRDRPNDLAVHTAAAGGLGQIARYRGQLRETARRADEVATINAKRGIAQAALTKDIGRARDRAWFFGDRKGAAEILDAAINQTPLDKLPIPSRPYQAIVETYALSGQTAKARHFMTLFDKSREQVQLFNDEAARHNMRGAIAVSEKRYADAIKEYRAIDSGPCPACSWADIAQAFDLAGQSDSAIANYERYQSTPDVNRFGNDGEFLAVSHKRLGELYEAKNEREKALSHYLAFVDLWKNADPELQPRVAEVRPRINRLKDRERR